MRARRNPVSADLVPALEECLEIVARLVCIEPKASDVFEVLDYQLMLARAKTKPKDQTDIIARARSITALRRDEARLAREAEYAIKVQSA